MSICTMSSTQPIRAAKVRSGDLIIVDGTNNPNRWDGALAAAWNTGVAAPAAAPTVSITAGTLRTITGAAAHGTLVQITTAASNVFATGDQVYITGVTGTTEANGVWTVTKIDATHYDLQSSVFTNTYVSGGTAVLLTGGATLGSYSFAYRYTDITAATDHFPGGVPSNLSPLLTVNASWGDKFNWIYVDVTGTRGGFVELWRTLSGETTTYYLVKRLAKGAGTTFTDTIGDNALATNNPNLSGVFAPSTSMAFLQPDGSPNAMRFVPPPSDAPYILVLQDRVFMAGRPGEHRNELNFSEPDEPESMPATNIVTIQDNTGDDDEVTGLIRHGMRGFILKNRHLYSLSYVKQPAIDASIYLILDRGALSDRCVTWFEEKAYIMDAAGIYSFDGGRGIKPISEPIQDIFRNGLIDFTASKWFWSSCDPVRRIIYFAVKFAADSGTRPRRALVYHPDTGVWDMDIYSFDLGGGALYSLSGQANLIVGGAGGTVYVTGSGLTDAGSAISWKHKTGMLEYPVADSQSKRSFTLTYLPAATNGTTINFQLFSGFSSTPINMNIYEDEGVGIVSNPGDPNIVIDISLNRSAQGPDPGYKQRIYAGSVPDRSQADRYVTFQISGTQSADQITIFDYEIQGASTD